MTGAAAPAGSDGVVILIEYTTLSGGYIEVQKGIQAGDNIVAAGSEAKAR